MKSVSSTHEDWLSVKGNVDVQQVEGGSLVLLRLAQGDWLAESLIYRSNMKSVTWALSYARDLRQVCSTSVSLNGL